jgi:CRISPR-associated protein Csm1
MTQQEKALILGSLFHDIGKFEQRCTKNPDKLKHEELGVMLIESGRFIDRFIKIVGKENLVEFRNSVLEHHRSKGGLTDFVKDADHLSASERVKLQNVEEPGEQYQSRWKHKHLSSLFSKVNLLNDREVPIQYYRHKLLNKEDYKIIIPQEMTSEEIIERDHSYTSQTFEDFKNDLEAVLDFYKTEEDFESLINLIIILFEKYMWCIPDFTGNEATDISLFNHLKDVAGISHSIYLTQFENPASSYLRLIIADLPGIQNYIFNVLNKKPAKILRGRSLFVQILTRMLSTKILKQFGLTEINLIMLAGGKFYIVAPDYKDFDDRLKQISKEINEYLFDEFAMDLSFVLADVKFDYPKLKRKEITFGEIIEEASYKLMENRNKLFSNRLFPDNNPDESKYVWEAEYINSSNEESDGIKCQVTNKPIRNGRKETIKVPSEDGYEELIVDKQVKIEYLIGDKVTKPNLVIEWDEKTLYINAKDISSITDYNTVRENNKNKILINPSFKELLSKENLRKDIFRNTNYLEAANYCSKSSKESIMPFDEMTKENQGAEYLTLIKGDIDNLGLIMAYGLKDDNNDLTSISRTTTLSNHLKYYFSFFLNGFLKDWDNEIENDHKVYTIFAGGDDLMLIAPQSSAVELVNKFNTQFNDFVCHNPEVHISFSITHFKHHTPIRMIAEFAEESQKKGKKINKNEQLKLVKSKDAKSFFAFNDKASTHLFGTCIKNSQLDYFIKKSNEILTLSNEAGSNLSSGLIRKLLELSEIKNKYQSGKDPSYLIAYARVIYTINRIIKPGNYSLDNFLKTVTSIHFEDDQESVLLNMIFHPLICQIIYKKRN